VPADLYHAIGFRWDEDDEEGGEET
jgi:hypothetical protein